MAICGIALALACANEQEALARTLSDAGFRADVRLAPAQLRPDAAWLREVDALLLEAGRGGLDGAATCAQLRRGGVMLPILVVHEGDGGVVHCLEAGANDGVARPVRGLELAARLRAQLRRHAGAPGTVVEIGPYLFRADRRELERAPGRGEEGGEGGPVVTTSDRAIRLTATEAAILRFLLAAEGRAVPRDVLLGEVWGYRAGVTTHTVETHIYRLRRKIEPEPGQRRLLLSDDAGYRLDRAGRGAPVRPEMAMRGSA